MNVKKWGVAVVVVCLCALAVLIRFNRSAHLLQDSDTKGILEGISNRGSPLSWFATDWPLENHFYRPVSTLAFELDKAVWGTNAAGFGFTNALLVALTILALGWFVRELTDSVALTAASAILFTAWCLDKALPPQAAWAMAATTLLPFFFRSHDRRSALVGALLWCLVAVELTGLTYLSYRMIDWLPGRTASCMTVFALIALALFARQLRHSCGQRPKPEPTPLDPPATKNTALPSSKPSSSNPVSLLVVIASLLALGSYEQAIMLLPIGIALMWAVFHLGFQVKAAHIWAMVLPTAIYLAVRLATVPIGVSRYQDQQFRASASVFYSLVDVAVPGLSSSALFLPSLVQLPELLLTPEPYVLAVTVAASIVLLFQLGRKGPVLTFAWAGSLLAFLPMAFLKHFDHYWFWPMAFRALFVAALVGVALEHSVSGWRRPTRQAPPRLGPAPGSLPRR